LPVGPVNEADSEILVGTNARPLADPHATVSALCWSSALDPPPSFSAAFLKIIQVIGLAPVVAAATIGKWVLPASVFRKLFIKSFHIC